MSKNLPIYKKIQIGKLKHKLFPTLLSREVFEGIIKGIMFHVIILYTMFSVISNLLNIR